MRALQRHGMEVSERPGVFQGRYGNAVSAPLLGPVGRVNQIVHHAEAITEFANVSGPGSSEVCATSRVEPQRGPVSDYDRSSVLPSGAVWARPVR